MDDGAALTQTPIPDQTRPDLEEKTLLPKLTKSNWRRPAANQDRDPSRDPYPDPDPDQSPDPEPDPAKALEALSENSPETRSDPRALRPSDLQTLRP